MCASGWQWGGGGGGGASQRIEVLFCRTNFSLKEIHFYHHHYYYSVSWTRYCTVFLYNGLAEMLSWQSYRRIFIRFQAVVVVYMSVQVIPYPAIRR